MFAARDEYRSDEGYRECSRPASYRASTSTSTDFAVDLELHLRHGHKPLVADCFSPTFQQCRQQRAAVSCRCMDVRRRLDSLARGLAAQPQSLRRPATYQFSTASTACSRMGVSAHTDRSNMRVGHASCSVEIVEQRNAGHGKVALAARNSRNAQRRSASHAGKQNIRQNFISLNVVCSGPVKNSVATSVRDPALPTISQHRVAGQRQSRHLCGWVRMSQLSRQPSRDCAPDNARHVRSPWRAMDDAAARRLSASISHQRTLAPRRTPSLPMAILIETREAFQIDKQVRRSQTECQHRHRLCPPDHVWHFSPRTPAA